MGSLPLTYYWQWRENPAEFNICRNIDVECVVTLILYRKESSWREVIRRFKYYGDRKLGRFLAGMLALKSFESGLFRDVDLIVPVPLHPLKRWMRGFNQATEIAKEISGIINIPVKEGILKKGRYTFSQTIKGRDERESGIKASFYVNKGEVFRNKHILLVDDVITTGATTCHCGREILKAGASRLSVAALAFVE